MGYQVGRQPPSGGCVLKPDYVAELETHRHQPPSGGCVLKLGQQSDHAHRLGQPPSGGCVLKHLYTFSIIKYAGPAAFGRLCVETTNSSS